MFSEKTSSFASEPTMDIESITASAACRAVMLPPFASASAAGSSQRRQALLRQLALPEHLTANGMLEALNLLVSREKLEELLADDR